MRWRPSFQLLFVCLLSGLWGCGSPERQPVADRLSVFVTIPPQAEFVERVGGTRVQVNIMVPVGAEPHTHEPAPQQLVLLEGAHLYARVGSGIAFERAWMDRIRAVNPGMHVVDCAAGIDLVEGDPHIWLSPSLARHMADRIREGLSRIDPEHAAHYRLGYEQYAADLAELDAVIRRSLQEANIRRFMVYHPAWGYFARDYGLEQLTVEHEGKEPTAQRLARVVQAMQETRIGAVFVSPQFDQRSARALAAETGAQVLSVDPLPRHYLQGMREFATALISSERDSHDE